MAVPEAVAGLAAIPGVRMAAQLGEPSLDTSASTDVLAVAPALAGLLPGGLRRGSTMSVVGSIALVLSFAGRGDPRWIVGDNYWHVNAGVAAAELGVDVDRLARVPCPGAEVAAVLSALVDGFDLVVLGSEVARGIQPQMERRLAGRLRNRVWSCSPPAPRPAPSSRSVCPPPVARPHREEEGFGHLELRDVVAPSCGRGTAVRPRNIMLQLTSCGGAVAAVEATAAAG
ncbi:hypothetical protein AB0F52_46120 [Amycolatopsis sp. NPDC024027]|uniref:hypothetical protein n=1 Tax=Amycolatopsis sp. NPDC024027 TaxID=3154327 RepID=UPI0033D79ED6